MGNEGKRIAIFSKGDDKFIDDIINRLSVYYNTKKINVSTQNLQQISDGMEWAELCWFEWCDELVVYASKLPLAKERRIICRLHSYEAFSKYPSQVNWSLVDKLILVSDYIKGYLIETFKIDKKIAIVIPNGVDMAKFSFKPRSPGFKVAYAGYINYKKGPMLLLQAFKSIFDCDSRYKFYIAGQFQDPRYYLYFKKMTRELGLESSLFFEGWQSDIDQWLEDKNYMVCTSVLESQNMSVMQAMAKGIKPVIHNFVGAEAVYDKKYLWNTVGEAVGMITEDSYASKEYRNFIQKNYSLEQQFEALRGVIEELLGTEKYFEKTGSNLPSTNGSPDFDYIRNKLNEFLPYDVDDFNSYNFNSAQIMLGKREKSKFGCELIEFILNNESKDKLIINNIWYDAAKNSFLLPEFMENSQKRNEIHKYAERLVKDEPEFCNNIAGFILDPLVKEEVKRNLTSYIWERGIPASQFMPLSLNLKIAERYTFASGFMDRESIVLEAPCGFGYGAAYFSKLCRHVEALDIAEDNITFAKEAYKNTNTNWTIGDITELPYENEEFDVYISYEVFEHLPVEMTIRHIEEAYRVLKNSGKFIISTPNQAMRKNVRNPFHTKEYQFEEFNSSVRKVFRKVDFYSVRDFKVESGMRETAYVMIAVCEK